MRVYKIGETSTLRSRAIRIGHMGVRDPYFKALSNQMLETMIHYKGVGLAAPQIGVRVRLIVLNKNAFSDADEIPEVILNPLPISYNDTLEDDTEGCLSIPGQAYTVRRHTKIRLRYRDLAGIEHSLRANGYLARVLQHEMDHLDGRLICDFGKKVEDEVNTEVKV